MEKFRAFLEVLKKFHFWVLCGLILLLSFASWFLATSDQEKRFLARKSQIEGKFNLVKAIANNPEHPSEKYNQALRDRESGPLASQVAKASDRLYREQRQNNHLPIVYSDETQQKDFQAAFEKIWGPMEEIANLPADRQMDPVYRQQYGYRIKDRFPILFDLIERRTAVAGADDADHGGRGPQSMGFSGSDAEQQAAKMVGIVDWVDADKKIAAFKDRLSSGTPSTLDIMMAQEDLWVYETLLKVIRYTNNVGPDRTRYPRPANEKEGHVDLNLLVAWLEKNYKKPPSHKDARIKQILAMDIGKDAVASWAKSERAVSNLASEASATQTAAATGGAATATNLAALAGRYVDDKGKPLADPGQQPYGEFRMMPINLKVVIEQREIPRLLAECGNSAMRIDVRGVRILVEEPGPADLTTPDASSGSTPATGAPEVHHERGMHKGPALGAHVGGDTGGGREGFFASEEESADPVYPPVVVEVQGIIYIYNPPRLQTPGETAGGNAGQPPPPPPVTATPTQTAPAAVPATGSQTTPRNKPSRRGQP